MKIVHRSVYIGIGGAGVRAISHTKKMYNEAFGEGNIPPVIAAASYLSSVDRFDNKHFVGI